MTMFFRLLLAASFCLGACGQAAEAQLVVEEGYVRGLPPGQQVTAAFMTLRNTGTTTLRVSEVYSALAERVEFHAHRHVDGMMRMQQQAELIIPGDTALQLEPGRMHLMLIGLRKELSPGDKVPISFRGQGFDEVQVELPVVSVTAP